MVSSPFYLNDYKRFGIKIFLKNGYNVEICNICPILYPTFFKKANKKNLYKGKLEKIFSHKQELEIYLKLNKKNLFILKIQHNFFTHFIFRAISILKIKYLFSSLNIVPSNIETNKNLNFRKFLSFEKIISIFLNKFFFFFKKKLQNIKPPTYFLAGGLKSLKSPQSLIIDNTTRIIWAHSYDYDDYLLINKNKKTNLGNFTKKNFAVFIDAPSPLIKNDALIPGISSPLTSSIYFPSLCSFFDQVEKNLNLEIVIAAHPRSNHVQRPKYFGKRKVFKNMTIELIKKSKLVINRNSTAINFAILYFKPLIFHTSKQILTHSVMSNQINSMSRLLNKKPINIDSLENIDWHEELNINRKLYINYCNQYIKNPISKKKFLWDIVVNEIDEKKN